MKMLILKTGVTILISNEVDSREKKITRGKERHYGMIEGSICQEDIMILNMCSSNNRVLKTQNKN